MAGLVSPRWRVHCFTGLKFSLFQPFTVSIYSSHWFSAAPKFVSNFFQGWRTRGANLKPEYLMSISRIHWESLLHPLVLVNIGIRKTKNDGVTQLQIDFSLLLSSESFSILQYNYDCLELLPIKKPYITWDDGDFVVSEKQKTTGKWMSLWQGITGYWTTANTW